MKMRKNQNRLLVQYVEARRVDLEVLVGAALQVALKAPVETALQAAPRVLVEVDQAALRVLVEVDQAAPRALVEAAPPEVRREDLVEVAPVVQRRVDLQVDRRRADLLGDRRREDLQADRRRVDLLVDRRKVAHRAPKERGLLGDQRSPAFSRASFSTEPITDGSRAT